VRENVPVATFRTYAEVLRPDHPQVAAHKAGLTCGPPGLVLGEILERTGGVYETTLPLTPRIREEMRELAEFSADEGLRRLADLDEVTISLEHLRHLDSRTRIVLGARLDFTPEESEWLRRTKEPEEPGTTLLGDFVIPGDEGEPPTGAC
jgi:hypothetical protein